MHNNPLSKDNFLVYLVTLTIGPAFLSAGIYLCWRGLWSCMERNEVAFGQGRIRFLFCSCDFMALLLQAAVGAIASSANTNSAVSILNRSKD